MLLMALAFLLSTFFIDVAVSVKCCSLFNCFGVSFSNNDKDDLYEQHAQSLMDTSSVGQTYSPITPPLVKQSVLPGSIPSTKSMSILSSRRISSTTLHTSSVSRCFASRNIHRSLNGFRISNTSSRGLLNPLSKKAEETPVSTKTEAMQHTQFLIDLFERSLSDNSEYKYNLDGGCRRIVELLPLDGEANYKNHRTFWKSLGVQTTKRMTEFLVKQCKLRFAMLYNEEANGYFNNKKRPNNNPLKSDKTLIVMDLVDTIVSDDHIATGMSYKDAKYLRYYNQKALTFNLIAEKDKYLLTVYRQHLMEYLMILHRVNGYDFAIYADAAEEYINKYHVITIELYYNWIYLFKLKYAKGKEMSLMDHQLLLLKFKFVHQTTSKYPKKSVGELINFMGDLKHKYKNILLVDDLSENIWIPTIPDTIAQEYNVIGISAPSLQFQHQIIPLHSIDDDVNNFQRKSILRNVLATFYRTRSSGKFLLLLAVQCKKLVENIDKISQQLFTSKQLHWISIPVI